MYVEWNGPIHSEHRASGIPGADLRGSRRTSTMIAGFPQIELGKSRVMFGGPGRSVSSEE